jgi:hypothetical protein
MNHPAPEALAAYVERKSSDPAITSHIADCDTCLAVVALLKRSTPRRARRSLFWAAAAALWLLAILSAALVPIPAKSPWTRTYAHIDFHSASGFVLAEGTLRQILVGEQLVTSADAVRSDGWWIVSVSLAEPLEVRDHCTMRVELSTSAGYCVASLFPIGKDAVYLRLEPSPSGEWSSVTANVNSAARAGSDLKSGDRVDRLAIAVPASGEQPPRLLVRAIALRTSAP